MLARALDRRPGRLPIGLGLLCLIVAFIQRPGLTVTDTRIDLSVNPSLFLSRVSEVFSGTGDLGHVQSGQFVGYLFPMGPWYELAHLAGLPTWIAQRLWLALVVFAAAYGMVRLMDVILSPRRGVAHAVAGILFALNPFTVVFVSRASVTLLGAAILPWLLIAVVRGIRAPDSWRWPALVGVLGALSGGGINAATLAWIAIAPVALLIYEGSAGRLGASAATKFGLRAVICGVLGSAWWIVPVLLQGAYGANFLNFTEQPQTIWATTSMSESLRLLGYWPLYFGTGYGGTALPTMSIAQTYLFAPFVVVASLAVPAAALLGLRSTRRWFYAPFFGLLAVLSLAVMCAGFPNGTAFSSMLAWLYNHAPSLRFLRTAYKAAPMLALSIAALGGVTAEALLAHVKARRLAAPSSAARTLAARARHPGIARRTEMLGRYVTLPGVGFALLACTPVLWVLPLFTGSAIDRRLAYGHVPRAWSQALTAAGRAAGQNQRTLVLPGELFGDYRWGRTWDSLAPALAARPVAIRQAVQYADPRAAQLLDDVDDLAQQARLVPGELAPLLRLLGVGPVLVATDALDSQAGGTDPADVAAALTAQPGFARPVASYGPRRRFLPAAGRDGKAWVLPELRRYQVGASQGLVRVDAAGPATILDGGPDGVVDLAAIGELRPGTPLFYAADLSSLRLAAFVRAGAHLVFTDSNPRRLVAATFVRQDLGTPLTATAPLPTDGAAWNVFSTAGSAARTVSVYSRLSDLFAPQPVGAQLFPAFAPKSALDGDLSTSWLPDPSLPASERWMQLNLAAPRTIGNITLVPKPVDGISPLWVAISVNGAPEREVLLNPGPNRVPIDANGVRTLRFRISRASTVQLFLGAGGLEEIQIPGVTPVNEALALPTLLAHVSGHLNTSHDEISIVLDRQTADFPTRVGTAQGVPLARSEIVAQDPEKGILRIVDLPATRGYHISGWASVSPTAPDSAIDALTGSLPGWSLTSSSRFEGVPGSRASSAFDRDRGTAWIGDLVPALSVQFGGDTSVLPLAAAAELLGGVPGERTPRWHGALQSPLPWLSIRGPRSVRLRRFQILPGPQRYAAPALVKVISDAGTSPALTVARNGVVTLPRAVRTRSLEIEIIAVHPPAGGARLRLLRAVAISEVRSPLRPPAPRRSGSLRTACGAVTIVAQHQVVDLQATGTVAELDSGSPLRVSGCGRARTLRLAAGRALINAGPGAVLRTDHLVLDSPPVVRAFFPPSPMGRVSRVDGLTASGVPTGATLSPHPGNWLVLGESYSRGWRAYCRGSAGAEQSLGGPVPIDGYANGWEVPPSCTHVRFAFLPQRVASLSYLVSLIAAPLLLGLALIPNRRSRVPVTLRVPVPPYRDPMVRLSWLGALTVGTVATVVIGFLFALPIGPLAVPLMRRGTSPRRLFTLGGSLLFAVPVAYLIRSAPNAGGFDFGYAYDNLLGHWLAVAGVCVIAGGCLLQLMIGARARRDPVNPPAAPAHSEPREPEPLGATAASP